MVDSWEDLCVLSEELECLESMFPDEYEAHPDTSDGFLMRFSEDGPCGQTSCVLTVLVPEDYPAGRPKPSIEVDHPDHLLRGRLQDEYMYRLGKWLGEQPAGEGCLSGLVEELRESMRVVGTDELDTCEKKVRQVSDASTVSTADTAAFLAEEDTPSGELLSPYDDYVAKPRMQGFAQKAVLLRSSSGYGDMAGQLVTWVPPRPGDVTIRAARQALLTLAGDGLLAFADLEIGAVQPGHDTELWLAVTASSFTGIRSLHDLDDAVCVALSGTDVRNSLGFVGGTAFAWHPSLSGRGVALQPGDRIGAWYTGQEFRVLRNGSPLLRLRAALGSATLLVTLSGRVTQLRANVAEPPTDLEPRFASMPLQGTARTLDDKWTKKELKALESLAEYPFEAWTP